MQRAWQDWVGRSEEAEDECALPLARRVAALLGRAESGLVRGAPLPAGWHMILFTPAVAQTALGPDGHPAGQEFLPLTPELPRRMLGGRRVSFLADLRIGDAVRRRSEIAAVEPKQGRSGRLLRVTVRHAIRVAGAERDAVVEEQDVIYREAAEPRAPDTAAAPAPAPVPEAEVSRPVAFDPVMLFRYSAITFNGHRIHYDHPYATGVEGYPDLVVNGGLTALLLLELGRSLGIAPTRMTARNLRPLFANRGATLCGRRDGEGWSLWAADAEHRPAVEVSLR